MSVSTAEGVELSRVQYARFADVLDGLAADEWALPVADCPGWSVQDVAAHVLGNLECQRSVPEFVRQVAHGWRLNPREPYEGLNAYQVRHAYASLAGPDIVNRIRATTEPALRQRARTPKALQVLIRPKLDVLGRVPMSFVLDTIFTRDTYMHRVDICRATGREVFLDDVERRVVEDMVGEWARHGQPYRLRLTGPAGGTYERGTGGEEIEIDAVEFSRIVGGRGSGDGLLRTRVQY